MSTVVSRFTEREREWLCSMPGWFDVKGRTILEKIEDLERLIFHQAEEIDGEPRTCAGCGQAVGESWSSEQSAGEKTYKCSVCTGLERIGVEWGDLVSRLRESLRAGAGS